MTPTCLTYKDGTKEWGLNGKLHRTDGPAIEGADGRKEWYNHGKRHREDGPAVVLSNGTCYWYLNGKELDPIVHFLKVGELTHDNG